MANISSGLGYSPLTEKVYYGRQNKEKRMWVGEKKDVTNDFLAVSHEFFEENTIRNISCGKKQNLFINIPNDKESIDKLIKNLQKTLTKK